MFIICKTNIFKLTLKSSKQDKLGFTINYYSLNESNNLFLAICEPYKFPFQNLPRWTHAVKKEINSINIFDGIPAAWTERASLDVVDGVSNQFRNVVYSHSSTLRPNHHRKASSRVSRPYLQSCMYKSIIVLTFYILKFLWIHKQTPMDSTSMKVSRKLWQVLMKQSR